MILALYSKGRFEEEARGKSVGDVFAIDRYTSKHKTFEALSQGGALFVVTVRPGDVLWLVAVLDNPSFEKGAWIAATNTTPITDITALLPQLELASGKGIKAGKGKLGMSLQTPRALSDGDIELLRAAAGSARRAPSETSAAKPTKTPRAKPAAASASALDDVAAHLGEGWRVDSGALVHEESGIHFAYVPGGWLRMGFSLDDLYEACCARSKGVDDESDWLGRDVARSRPPHVVEIVPFVIALKRHPAETMHKPFRLPSEAELEWVYRRGGADRWAGVSDSAAFRGRKRWACMAEPDMPFGIELAYNEHEHCADSWHDNYDGAPTTSEPWGNDGEVYRCLHTAWQDDDEEMLSVHAAYREGPSHPREQLRLTMPLPDYAPGRARGEPPDAVEAERLLAALRDGDKKARSALKVIARAPADDVRVVVNHVAEHLPQDAKALRSSLGFLVTLCERAPQFRHSLPASIAQHLGHDDKRIRLAVATLVGDASELATQLSKEKDKSVAATLVLALALQKQPAPDTGDEKLERALAPIRAIADGLRGDLDYDAIIDSFERQLPKVPWFDGDLYSVRLDLLRNAPLDVIERAKPLERLALLFPRREELLRMHELTPEQKRLVESMDSPLRSGMRRYGLPSSQLGWDILRGRSTSRFAIEVDTVRGKKPLFHALIEAHANGESGDDLLRDIPLIEVLKMDLEAAEDMNLSDWRFSQARGVPWPLKWVSEQVTRIQGASARERAALRHSVLEHLATPTADWPHPHWPVHLAATLAPGEPFPEQAIGHFTSRGLHEFRLWKGPEIHFAEPALNDWLFEHVAPAIRDDTPERAIALYTVWTPTLRTSSVLLCLAANISHALGRLRDTPTMKARYWDFIPQRVHDDGNTRKAELELLDKAFELRSQGD